MGGDGSKNKTSSSSSSSLVKRRSLSCHQGFLSLSAPLVHHSAQHREYPISEHSRPSDTHPEGPRLEWTLPGFISIFLPEFPHRFTGHKHLQILGFIAKGSFGPILKVKDLSKDETYAIKVLPKADVLRHGVLQQSKEEVIIQRQVRHPFLLSLRDCWQSQSNLFITPEVLSGGPYSHAADWWSLGILIYTLATGGFPLPAEPDHCSMMNRVSEHPYDMPANLSPALAFLLIELLCKIPTRRLRCLDRFQSQKFFHGMSFDSQLLQRRPIKPILELKNHPDRSERSMRGLSSGLLQSFECDLLNSPSTPVEVPTSMKIEVNEDTAATETKATGTSSP